MKTYYLYKILNSVTDKVYIGITAHPERRFKEHFSERSNSTKLKRSILKHGRGSFSFHILCVGTEDYILDLEVKAIQSYDSINNGYNLVLGNPRTGGASLSEEVKDNISASLAKYYKENSGWNLGGTVAYRSDDIPICVTGFWFPNRRTALKYTTLNEKTIYKWNNQGTLDQVQHLCKDSLENKPMYVGGFWFDSLETASSKLKVKKSTLVMRIRRGSVEANSRKPESKKAEKNPMFGRTGSEHPRSRAIKIFDITYASISDAVRKTDFTKSMIEKRLKDKIEGFEYDNPS